MRDKTLTMPATAVLWIIGGDTGTSSKTIWAVLSGAVDAGAVGTGTLGFDAPYDDADFGRCYRLLKAVPEWRERLPEVAVRIKKWAPFVENWVRLEALYEKSLAEDGECGASDTLRRLARALWEESMRRDGYRLEAGQWLRPAI